MRSMNKTFCRIGILLAVTMFDASVVMAHFNPGAPCDDPPCNCFDSGPLFTMRELFDTNADGCGDTPVNRPKINGETIYYQAKLEHSGYPNCGYEGGAVCIDVPAPGGVCTPVWALQDETLPGGATFATIPLL